MTSDTITLLTEELLPLTLVVTPNIPEAEVLSGIIITSFDDMKKAALIIHGTGVGNVVIKGGHLPSGGAAGGAGSREDCTEYYTEYCIDVLYDGANFHEFSSPRINTKDTHGTGCTFASALATLLADGSNMREAVTGAKEYVTEAIRHAWRLGGGQGPLNHLAPLLNKKL
jgi:hydroxymethylpyrimidine kinase/phosphomethylpyrimidine kinase